jgi:hypothetical protein
MVGYIGHYLSARITASWTTSAPPCGTVLSRFHYNCRDLALNSGQNLGHVTLYTRKYRFCKGFCESIIIILWIALTPFHAEKKDPLVLFQRRFSPGSDRKVKRFDLEDP